MRDLIALFFALDETNSTNKKNEILVEYLQQSPPEDVIWVIFFLSGNRFKRLLSTKKMRAWTREEYDIPKWLFDEAMVAVGDTGETISLLIDTLRSARGQELDHWPLHRWIDAIQNLRILSEEEQKVTLTYWWSQLDQEGIFVLNKLLTGAFRVGVNKQTMARAVADAHDLDKTTILHRMMGNWEPTVEFYQQLVSEDETDADISTPYPFFLASPLEQELEDLGNASDWYVEWKWDGIRSQVIKREQQVFIWSRGEELINPGFPELAAAMVDLPDGTVLDAEILAYFEGEPLSFSVLQRRIGRQDASAKIQQEAPVILMVYDLVEYEGKDLRDQPHSQRRQLLANIFEQYQHRLVKLSPLLESDNWEQVRQYRQQAREELSEGVMLKRKSAHYQVGRKRGDWYKYKVDPLSVDAILIYAQSGSGRRANLFTAYTFAVWSEDGTDLIPIGRAYSGLTNEEIKELDGWIRSNTTEKFGPVRSVDPVQVFELGFDGIMTNERTKSGLSLRFPRMLRWRKDKPATEADTIETTRALLKFEGKTEVRLNYSLDDFF